METYPSLDTLICRRSAVSFRTEVPPKFVLYGRQKYVHKLHTPEKAIAVPSLQSYARKFASVGRYL